MPTFTVRWIDPADRTVRTVCLRDTSCARVIMRLESIGVEAQSVGAVIEPRGLRNVTLIVCGVGLILLVGSAQFPAIAVLVTVAAMLATSLIVGPLLRARFQSRRLIAADEELTVDRLRQWEPLIIDHQHAGKRSERAGLAVLALAARLPRPSPGFRRP